MFLCSDVKVGVTLKVSAISWLSSYEERIMEAIIENGSVGAAASELKIARSTVYTVLSKVRLKVVKSQNTVNKVNNFTKQSRALKRLLIPIQKVRISESVEEEELEEEF